MLFIIGEVDDDNFPITYVDENEEIVSTTWGQYKKNIPQDKRYLTVPIIAYHGDTPIFTIHNHLWYNKFNVQANPLQTQDEVIEEGQRRVIETKKGGKGGKQFNPPTLEEFQNYWEDNGYDKNKAVRAWKGYDAANWSDSKGNKVKNWKQKCFHVWFKDENRKIKNHSENSEKKLIEQFGEKALRY